MDLIERPFPGAPVSPMRPDGLSFALLMNLTAPEVLDSVAGKKQFLMAINRSMLKDTSETLFAPGASRSRRQPEGSTGQEELDLSSCGLAPESRPEHVYNEEAFRYFLDIERKRSELSTRPFLLLLIDLKHQSVSHGQIDSAASRKLFSALSRCVRETDFIGWYRKGQVAGAVLTQHADTPSTDVSDTVRQRIARALDEALPSHLGDRLQVRVYQLPKGVHVPDLDPCQP